MPGESPSAEPVVVPHTERIAARVAPPPAAPPAPVLVAPPAPPTPVAPPVAEMTADATPVPGPYDAHCKAVAHQRSADARANGYSFAMADTIYGSTYKDCLAWDTQHGLGVSQ